MDSKWNLNRNTDYCGIWLYIPYQSFPLPPPAYQIAWEASSTPSTSWWLRMKQDLTVWICTYGETHYNCVGIVSNAFQVLINAQQTQCERTLQTPEYLYFSGVIVK